MLGEFILCRNPAVHRAHIYYWTQLNGEERAVRYCPGVLAEYAAQFTDDELAADAGAYNDGPDGAP